MKNKRCEKCEYFFCRISAASPCAHCIKGSWGDGFRPARNLTKIRVLGVIIRKKWKEWRRESH